MPTKIVMLLSHQLWYFRRTKVLSLWVPPVLFLSFSLSHTHSRTLNKEQSYDVGSESFFFLCRCCCCWHTPALSSLLILLRVIPFLYINKTSAPSLTSSLLFLSATIRRRVTSRPLPLLFLLTPTHSPKGRTRHKKRETRHTAKKKETNPTPPAHCSPLTPSPYCKKSPPAA